MASLDPAVKQLSVFTERFSNQAEKVPSLSDDSTADQTSFQNAVYLIVLLSVILMSKLIVASLLRNILLHSTAMIITSNFPNDTLETHDNLRSPWRNFDGKSSMITGMKD